MSKALVSAIRARALSYPDTEEAFPWGERVIKVKKKVFIFMGDVTKPDVVQMGVKLPFSGPAVLKRKYAKPSGYGLGKAGWVSIGGEDAKGITISKEDIFAWLDESYRAVAPKTSIAKLDASPPAKKKK
jgi:predicted DNA-binding protein (MmcQ/YjbR family)